MKKQALQAKQLQAEALTTVGTKLTQVREQRELSVEDLAVKTHIPARLLQAIERGDMSQLPEPVYIQSFIRQYANAMGVNGVQIASEFPVEPVVRPPSKPFWNLPSWQLRPVHLYATYLLVIFGAIQGLSYAMTRSASQLPPGALTQQPNQQAQSSAPEMVGPAPKATTTTSKTVVSSVPTNASANPQDLANKPVKVTLTTTDSSWVKLVVDGKEEFEGTLTPGDKRLLMAKQRVTVIAGNAGGVVATFNDGEAKPLGAPGSVQEVSFPPEARDIAIVNSTRMAQNDQ
jgi:cytoskeletal protein RodZ